MDRQALRMQASLMSKRHYSERRGILALSIVARAGRGHAPFLRRHLPEAYGLVKSGLRELSLVLVGDEEMGALHQRFLGVAGPTDVLSFELEHDRRGGVVGGEVVVCVPEARRQARARRIPLQSELLLYAVHGLLHLSGYDDTDAAGYRKMHTMEDRILTRLGIGRVFAPRGRKASAGKAGSRR